MFIRYLQLWHALKSQFPDSIHSLEWLHSVNYRPRNLCQGFMIFCCHRPPPMLINWGLAWRLMSGRWPMRNWPRFWKPASLLPPNYLTVSHTYIFSTVLSSHPLVFPGSDWNISVNIKSPEVLFITRFGPVPPFRDTGHRRLMGSPLSLPPRQDFFGPPPHFRGG